VEPGTLPRTRLPLGPRGGKFDSVPWMDILATRERAYDRRAALDAVVMERGMLLALLRHARQAWA
jgi:hypothetical protein